MLLRRCARSLIDDLPSLAAQRVARRGWKKANRRVDVILTADVPGLGERDEIARVRPGRARNHLVPERLATYVSEEKVARARERLLAKAAAREATEGEGEAEAQSAREEAAREKENETVMRMLTAEPAIAVKRILDKKTGKPLRPVTRENIVDEIRRQKQLQIAPASLVLERPIDQFGQYDIPLWIRGHARGSHVLNVIVRKRQ